MKLGKTLYVSDRERWRAWLARHHAAAKEIWLVYPKKHSGKKRIPYNDAVEEALCFGWIDSTAKKIDDASFAQRFSPRRKGSVLSQANRERIRKLISQKRMTPAGLAAVSHAFDPASKEEFVVARDVLAAVKADEAAWKNFRRFPERYKRIRIGYIEGQRRHSAKAFKKSLAHFVRKTAKNKKFGFVMV